VIHVSDDEAVVEDLGSKNGTLVNGSRLESPSACGRDRLEIGVAMDVPRRHGGDSTETGTAG